MPTFLNDENSPIYSSNAGVVHIGNHHEPGGFYKLSDPKDTLLPRPLSTAIDTNESFDDNSSSHSSRSSDARLRVNADGLPPSSMTSLPNGRSSRDSNGVATASYSNLKAPLSVNGNSISENQRQSMESSSRVSIQLQQLVEPHRKSFGNGDMLSADGTYGNNQASAPPNSSSSVPSYLLPNPYLNTPSTPSSDHAQRGSPSPQRFSAPSQYPATGTSASQSTSALQPPTQGLKHRHTLEVPRVQPGRGSKDSNETAYASGRFSPTGAGPSQRRGSLNLGRRNTRSLHSDLPRDEILPDDDALRWAEAYRQKRAKKKRREEEDDDRVLVGTKVDENHANWTTAYNMLTGIRVSVSRTNAKLDRPLTDADFETKQKSTFDM